MDWGTRTGSAATEEDAEGYPGRTLALRMQNLFEALSAAHLDAECCDSCRESIVTQDCPQWAVTSGELLGKFYSIFYCQGIVPNSLFLQSAMSQHCEMLTM